MLYALIGSLLAGSLSTIYVLWRKSKLETELKGAQKDLKASAKELVDLEWSHANLKKEYNSLVDSANEQIKTLHTEKEELLDALQKSGKPGVFADLLRQRNTKP